MSSNTGVSMDRSGTRWLCEAGHRHKDELRALRCQGARDHGVAAWVRSLMKPGPSFQRALTRWRPIPADQRDDIPAPVQRGKFDGATFRSSLGGWAFGAAVGLCMVAFVVVGGALQHGIVLLGESGHELIAVGLVALVALAIACVPVVQKPGVRKALRWVRETWS